VLHSLTSAAAGAAVLTKTQTKPAGQLQSLAPVERDGMTKNKECLGNWKTAECTGEANATD